MAVYLISYNTGNDPAKFRAVDRAVKNCSVHDVWMYYIDNTWLIKSKMSADEIGRKINAVTAEEDSFIVIEVTNNFAGCLPKEGFDFIYTKFF